MKKILAVLFACSIVLAGCMDLTDEDIDAIVDAIVEIPGCNADETAYNYDVNATNNNACLTEMVLKNSIADFITLMDNGPGQDQTMGMSMTGSGDMEGQQMDWTSVNVYSPDGSYTSMELDLGMLVWSQSQLITSAADGTTLMQVNHNGAQMLMNSATDFSSWNSMDDDDMGDDDMDLGDNDMGGNDMDDDNMEMSLPEVEVPADFDPSTALFEAGLATDKGYSFSTTMDDGMDYSMTMTFTLGMDLVVNSMTITETMEGESSTSSITMLEESTSMGYLTIDSTLPYQALPFGVSPMGGIDSGDNDMGDNVDWESYDGGYCAWEGNSDDGEDVWSCKDDESDDDWDTWWYYCELHDGDWHCTDDFGQSSDYENSADLDEYDAHEGHDHGDDGHDDHGDSDDALTAQDLMYFTDTDGSGTMSFDEFIEYMSPDPDDEDGDDGHDDHSDDEHDDHGNDDEHDDSDDMNMNSMSVEIQFTSVADLYENWGHVLVTEGSDCVGCEGNLASMTPFTSFDITNQSEFENTTGQYGEIYFQFIDQNENNAYDSDEIYGISLEINVNSAAPGVSYVSYNGEWYTNKSGSGNYEFAEFWQDAYGYSWDDGDHEDENMACYDPNMEEYDFDYMSQIECESTDFIWMNLDDDHNENGIYDDDEFICDNGNIIHIDLVNNQIDDCGDGSDESHSDDQGDDESLPQSIVDDFNVIFDNNDADLSGDLDLNELEYFILDLDEYFMSMDGSDGELFTCDNGNEVPADYVDDGDNDCGDWSDEPNHNDNGDDGMDDDSSGVSESELFAAADSDNDGLVTTSDIVDAVLSMDAPTPQDALDEGDIDQSDNISWDEFVQLWNMEEDENDADDQHLNNNPQLESDLHAAFNGSDSDYDGNLSIDELQSFIDDVTTISNTQEEITEMITIFGPYVACVDSNSDGSLDQVEFSDFYGAVMYGMENTELVFCTVDSNQDGIVTVSEYVDLINQTGMYSEENPMTEQDWEGFTSLFGIYDTDGIDGLSLTEYQSMMEDISPGGDDDGGTFICENGGEVPASFVDDGYNDCGDWSDEPNHSNNGDGGHGDHGSMFDWMISNSQDMPMEGSFDDYTIVLAMCTIDESSDDGMDMGMGTTPAMNCDDDVLSVTIADAMAQDAVVMFHDADMSGTISGGDMVHISPDIDVDGDWNMVRLYSTSADAYSDENPMLTPGFTGALGMLALLGAALLTRRD